MAPYSRALEAPCERAQFHGKSPTQEMYFDTTCKLAAVDGGREETSPRAVSAPKRTKLAAASSPVAGSTSAITSSDGSKERGYVSEYLNGSESEYESENVNECGGVRVQRKSSHREDSIQTQRLRSLGTRRGTPSRKALHAVSNFPSVPPPPSTQISTPSSTPGTPSAPTSFSVPAPALPHESTPPSTADPATPAPAQGRSTGAPAAHHACNTGMLRCPSSSIALEGGGAPWEAVECPLGAMVCHSSVSSCVEGSTQGEARTTGLEGPDTMVRAGGVPSSAALVECCGAENHSEARLGWHEGALGIVFRIPLECSCAHCHGKSLSARVASLMSSEQASMQPTPSPQGSPMRVPVTCLPSTGVPSTSVRTAGAPGASAGPSGSEERRERRERLGTPPAEPLAEAPAACQDGVPTAADGGKQGCEGETGLGDQRAREARHGTPPIGQLDGTEGPQSDSSSSDSDRGWGWDWGVEREGEREGEAWHCARTQSFERLRKMRLGSRQGSIGARLQAELIGTVSVV